MKKTNFFKREINTLWCGQRKRPNAFRIGVGHLRRAFLFILNLFEFMCRVISMATQQKKQPKKVVEVVKIEQPYFKETNMYWKLNNDFLDECYKVGWLTQKLADLGYEVKFERA